MSEIDTGIESTGGHDMKEGKIKDLKINIYDMIYILNLQKKNPHIDRVMAKYGIDENLAKDVKAALKRGKWKVTR